MNTETADKKPAKPRKRLAAKTLDGPSPDKVKATLHLTVEANQRLTIHATMMGLDRSELIEKLINDNLRRWVVSDRGSAEASANGERP